MIIEICANSFESTQVAQLAGANRIEIFTELSVGGLTPSQGLIEKVVSEFNIPIHVLIRPRSGNFTYSEEEFDVMLRDITFCKKLGCAGIVSGFLTSENKIDSMKTKQLIDASEGMEFTFHRAFDWVENPIDELQKLIDLKVNRLLSSGQKPTAIEGISLLKELQNHSKGKIEIMPGGGINVENALKFKEAGFNSIHLSATAKKQLLAQKPKVTMHSDAFFEEGIIATSDKETIQNIITLLA
ncbi:copper homeostasis protein CutC [Aequorivita antarctica]|uniref:PF03932 family protein CutC n=1 Tax=Aequorivita antarctica TaxID=153266 RepID=A0A5C6Z5I7_9FLAO|nr:copper homeostasis protein CutC [Aequorivita antarctica]TXD74674.1 copper homeostasis protein CutC [Aequorivita antarctica]SRX72691.1 Copper homeostasis protein CutC [Aequorivita antarctica]